MMDSVNIDEKLARALVKMIMGARGRRVTIKTSALVRLAGLEDRHKNILKAAKMLSKLSKRSIIRVEFKDKISRAKSIMYVVDDQMDIWKMSKTNPEAAIRTILDSLGKIKEVK